MSETASDVDEDDLEARIEELESSLTYPQYTPTVVPVALDEDTLHVRGGPWSGPVVTIKDEAEQGLLSELNTLVDGQTHVREIVERFDEPEYQREIVETLETLEEKAVLQDTSRIAEEEQYHHTVLSMVEDWESLAAATVGIVNIGVLGADVARDVLSLPVERVEFLQPRENRQVDGDRLPDDDEFELAETDIVDLVDRNDFVIYAADGDYPDYVERVNEVTYETKTPWLPIQILGTDGVIGPSTYPDETACHNCFRKRVLSTAVAGDRYERFREHLSDTPQTRSWDEVLPPFARVISGIAARDLQNLLSSGVGFTAGRAIVVDIVDMSMSADRVLKAPRCEVCGAEPGRDSPPYLTLDHLINEDSS